MSKLHRVRKVLAFLPGRLRLPDGRPAKPACTENPVEIVRAAEFARRISHVEPRAAHPRMEPMPGRHLRTVQFK